MSVIPSEECSCYGSSIINVRQEVEDDMTFDKGSLSVTRVIHIDGILIEKVIHDSVPCFYALLSLKRLDFYVNLRFHT